MSIRSTAPSLPPQSNLSRGWFTLIYFSLIHPEQLHQSVLFLKHVWSPESKTAVNIKTSQRYFLPFTLWSWRLKLCVWREYFWRITSENERSKHNTEPETKDGSLYVDARCMCSFSQTWIYGTYNRFQSTATARVSWWMDNIHRRKTTAA